MTCIYTCVSLGIIFEEMYPITCSLNNILTERTCYRPYDYWNSVDTFGPVLFYACIFIKFACIFLCKT